MCNIIIFNILQGRSKLYFSNRNKIVIFFQMKFDLENKFKNLYFYNKLYDIIFYNNIISFQLINQY